MGCSREAQASSTGARRCTENIFLLPFLFFQSLSLPLWRCWAAGRAHCPALETTGLSWAPGSCYSAQGAGEMLSPEQRCRLCGSGFSGDGSERLWAVWGEAARSAGMQESIQLRLPASWGGQGKPPSPDPAAAQPGCHSCAESPSDVTRLPPAPEPEGAELSRSTSGAGSPGVGGSVEAAMGSWHLKRRLRGAFRKAPVLCPGCSSQHVCKVTGRDNSSLGSSEASQPRWPRLCSSPLHPRRTGGLPALSQRLRKGTGTLQLKRPCTGTNALLPWSLQRLTGAGCCLAGDSSANPASHLLQERSCWPSPAFQGVSGLKYHHVAF